MIVLDRPNPIGGDGGRRAGPRRRTSRSFIAYHALPVRHGMTVGELARLFNAERTIGADLTRHPLRGLAAGRPLRPDGPALGQPVAQHAEPDRGAPLSRRRPPRGDATSRPAAAPTRRSSASAPPGSSRAAFAAALNDLGLPGVRFVPIRFTPKERQYAGEECGGVQIVVTDWAAVEPVDVGVGLAVVLRRLYRDGWKPDGFLRMLADRDGYRAPARGRDVAAIRAAWAERTGGVPADSGRNT